MDLSRHLLLAGCLTAGTAVYAVESANLEIRKILVEGTVRIHPARVKMRLKSRSGTAYDPQVVADDVKAIYQMGAFTDVRTEVRRLGAGLVDVVFHVEELPYVGRVRLEGVGWWTRSSVRDLLGIRRGEHLEKRRLELDCRAIEEFYRERNYPHVEVTAETRIDPRSRIGTVIYRVDLGVQVTVARTLYPGLPDEIVKLFLDGQLVNAPGRPFHHDMAALDREAVARYLQDQGWLDARVSEVRIELFDRVDPSEPRHWQGPDLVPEGEDDDAVVVTYFVDPGPRYRLGTVRFLGNETASDVELRRAFGMKAGSSFVQRDLQKAIDEALRVVKNQGHARAAFREDRRYRDDGYVVDLALHLVEGRKYRVGRIDPFGNTVTKAQVIYREFSLGPGDLYNQSRIDESERQLRRTGLFEDGQPRPLRIITHYPADRPGQVDLRVDVEEADTGSVSVSGGWSSSNGFSGRMSYTERNFDTLAFLRGEGLKGAAHQVQAHVAASRYSTSFGATWANPRVMDGPYFLSLSFNRMDSTAIDWNEKRQESSASVGRYFLDYDLRLSMGYAYTDLDIRHVAADASDSALLKAPGHFHLNTVSLTQVFDRRDNAAYPTEGFRIEAGERLSGGALSASHPYYELTLNLDGYLPLYEADLGGVTHLHAKQRLAYLGTLHEDDQVPFYDRYYGGGTRHHRGYDQYKLGPEEQNFYGYTARPGGTRDWLSTLELVVPLQGTRNGFQAVVFGDAGYVWGEHSLFRLGDFDMPWQEWRNNGIIYDFLGRPGFLNPYTARGERVIEEEAMSLSDIKFAVGVGVRFPRFLPVSLDLAWLLNGDPGDDDQQVHFSMDRRF